MKPGDLFFTEKESTTLYKNRSRPTYLPSGTPLIYVHDVYPGNSFYIEVISPFGKGSIWHNEPR